MLTTPAAAHTAIHPYCHTALHQPSPFERINRGYGGGDEGGAGVVAERAVVAGAGTTVVARAASMGTARVENGWGNDVQRH